MQKTDGIQHGYQWFIYELPKVSIYAKIPHFIGKNDNIIR